VDVSNCAVAAVGFITEDKHFNVIKWLWAEFAEQRTCSKMFPYRGWSVNWLRILSM